MCEARARLVDKMRGAMTMAADALETAYGRMHHNSSIGDLIRELRALADDGE
jgi:hypothetical protein